MGTPRDTVYSRGKGINKHKTNKQIKCVCLVKSAVCDARRRSAAVYRRLRCAACLLSRKDCSVMKKINSTNNAEQPRPPAPNKNKTNLRVNLEFVLFFTRDYFGLRVS